MRNSRNDWTRRIPRLAFAMESLLYRDTSSFEQYMDMSTFPQRLDAVMTSFINQVNASSDEETEDVTIDELADSLDENL